MENTSSAGEAVTSASSPSSSTSSSTEASPPHRFLFCGLGGGLDVVNASIPFFASRNEGKHACLGSIRPCPLDRVENHGPAFATNGTHIKGDSKVTVRGRYAEPRVAQLVGEDIILLSRFASSEEMSKSDPKDKEAEPPAERTEGLRNAIEAARKEFGFTHMFFCDGGGDSLILREEDGCAGSETTNPFCGGDAEALKALRGLPNVYHAVVAVGLDISRDAFQENLAALRKRGGYFGRVNLLTGEQDEYTLGHLLSFKEGWKKEYMSLADSILVLKQKHQEDRQRTKSHTATVTYHAINGNFGLQRTFVPWEPRRMDGSRGVIVDEEHPWLYFFDPSVVEQVKLELNKRES